MLENPYSTLEVGWFCKNLLEHLLAFILRVALYLLQGLTNCHKKATINRFRNPSRRTMGGMNSLEGVLVPYKNPLVFNMFVSPLEAPVPARDARRLSQKQAVFR